MARTPGDHCSPSLDAGPAASDSEDALSGCWTASCGACFSPLLLLSQTLDGLSPGHVPEPSQKDWLGKGSGQHFLAPALEHSRLLP